MEEDSESFKDDFYGMVKFLQRLFVAGPGRKSALDKAVEAASRANLDSHPCGSNFTCIKDRFLQCKSGSKNTGYYTLLVKTRMES